MEILDIPAKFMKFLYHVLLESQLKRLLELLGPIPLFAFNALAFLHWTLIENQWEMFLELHGHFFIKSLMKTNGNYPNSPGQFLQVCFLYPY